MIRKLMRIRKRVLLIKLDYLQTSFLFLSSTQIENIPSECCSIIELQDSIQKFMELKNYSCRGVGIYVFGVEFSSC